MASAPTTKVLKRSIDDIIESSLLAINDALERRFGFVRIKPHAAMGDATVALHMSRLDDDEAGARIRQHAKMGKVPISGATVGGAVLAHRGYDDAILQFDRAEFDRRKQDAGHEVGTGPLRRATNIFGIRSQQRPQPVFGAGGLCAIS